VARGPGLRQRTIIIIIIIIIILYADALISYTCPSMGVAMANDAGKCAEEPEKLWPPEYVHLVYPSGVNILIIIHVLV